MPETDVFHFPDESEVTSSPENFVPGNENTESSDEEFEILELPDKEQEVGPNLKPLPLKVQ